MKAMILAAGFGTRLKPWTDEHPKALVPVGGVPMLQRVIERLIAQGFTKIIVNVHHFAGQILDFLAAREWNAEILVSDESERILDTGGAILRAARLLCDDDEPFLVHNVDILSDAPLKSLMLAHRESGRDISLVTSHRDSSRKLVFDAGANLRGWHNVSSGEYRPAGFVPDDGDRESAFSGIYIVDPIAIVALRDYSQAIGSDAFPVMDFFLAGTEKINIGEIKVDKLNLIDIGKPDTLRQADALFF